MWNVASTLLPFLATMTLPKPATLSPKTATMSKQHSTLSKRRNFTIESFDIVAVCGNKVECCFDNVACCFDIVAGVDGALVCMYSTCVSRTQAWLLLHSNQWLNYVSRGAGAPLPFPLTDDSLKRSWSPRTASPGIIFLWQMKYEVKCKIRIVTQIVLDTSRSNNCNKVQRNFRSCSRKQS